MLPASFHIWSRNAKALGIATLLGACSISGPDRVVPLTPQGSVAEGSSALTGQSKRWLRMAESAAASGDRQTALGLYQQVLAHDQKVFPAWYGLGDLLLKGGNVRGSADAFAQVLKHKDGDPQASVGYAKAMMALSRPDAAAAHIEPLLETDPENLRVLNLLAVIRDLQGDHDGAQGLYRRGLFVNPESIMLRNNMALSAALAGKYEGAIELMKPVVDGLNSNRQTRQNYALIQGLAGNFAQAEEISLIDLNAQSTANNIAYYSALRSMEPSQLRSAVLRPNKAAASDFGVRDDNDPVVFGVSIDGNDLAIADTPNDAWFLQLGSFDDKSQATAFWQDLQKNNPTLLDNLQPLAMNPLGSQQLAIGPISDKASADDICKALKTETCSAISL